MKTNQWENLTETDKAMLLRRNRGVLWRVARALDVTDGLVSRVWWGKATSARVLAAILKAVKP